MVEFSHSGIEDIVPREVRSKWCSDGVYPNKSLFELFSEKAKSHPDKEAVISLNSSVTYSVLYDFSLRLASRLKSTGISKGDIIAYSLPNSWRCCVIDLAAAAIGAITLPFPQGRSAADIEILMRRSCARVLIVEPVFKEIDICEMIESFRSRTLGLRFLVGCRGSADRKSGVKFNREGWSDFDDWMNTSIMEEYHHPNVDPDSPAKILVSSGTEAEPKLVAYSHNALAGGRGRFLGNLTPDTSKFIAFYLVPLGSAFGSTATFGVLCWLGGTLVLQQQFDAEKTIQAIHLLEPTHILGVPTMFQRLLSCVQLNSIDKSKLEILVTGGAPMDKTTMRRCMEEFGCKLISLYGSADGVNCHNSLEDKQDIIFSCIGKPNADICDIKIIDENEKEVSRGEIGEIIARGAITPMQYVNAPDLDKRYRNREGWVFTGDLGKLDANGYLVLSGRKKDVIIRGGVNISPVQIEQTVTAHENVLSAACVPISDVELGQRICLCLSLKNGSDKPSLSDINAFLVEQGLDINKLPEYLCFYRHLPLNPAGKVNKKQLSEELKLLSYNAFVVDPAGSNYEDQHAQR